MHFMSLWPISFDNYATFWFEIGSFFLSLWLCRGEYLSYFLMKHIIFTCSYQILPFQKKYSTFSKVSGRDSKLSGKRLSPMVVTNTEYTKPSRLKYPISHHTGELLHNCFMLAFHYFGLHFPLSPPFSCHKQYFFASMIRWAWGWRWS